MAKPSPSSVEIDVLVLLTRVLAFIPKAEIMCVSSVLCSSVGLQGSREGEHEGVSRSASAASEAVTGGKGGEC